MPTQGSWRPLVTMSVASPALLIVGTGVRIELVGLNATRTTTGWPVEIPPAMPPPLFDRKSGRLLPSVAGRLGSAFSSPRSRAARQPAPLPPPFTALIPTTAAARSPSRLAQIGAPPQPGPHLAAHSNTPPTQLTAFRAASHSPSHPH